MRQLVIATVTCHRCQKPVDRLEWYADKLTRYWVFRVTCHGETREYRTPRKFIVEFKPDIDAGKFEMVAFEDLKAIGAEDRTYIGGAPSISDPTLMQLVRQNAKVERSHIDEIHHRIMADGQQKPKGTTVEELMGKPTQFNRSPMMLCDECCCQAIDEGRARPQQKRYCRAVCEACKKIEQVGLTDIIRPLSDEPVIPRNP